MHSKPALPSSSSSSSGASQATPITKPTLFCPPSALAVFTSFANEENVKRVAGYPITDATHVQNPVSLSDVNYVSEWTGFFVNSSLCGRSVSPYGSGNDENSWVRSYGHFGAFATMMGVTSHYFSSLDDRKAKLPDIPYENIARSLTASYNLVIEKYMQFPRISSTDAHVTIWRSLLVQDFGEAIHKQLSELQPGEFRCYPITLNSPAQSDILLIRFSKKEAGNTLVYEWIYPKGIFGTDTQEELGKIYKEINLSFTITIGESGDWPEWRSGLLAYLICLSFESFKMQNVFKTLPKPSTGNNIADDADNKSASNKQPAAAPAQPDPFARAYLVAANLMKEDPIEFEDDVKQKGTTLDYVVSLYESVAGSRTKNAWNSFKRERYLPVELKRMHQMFRILTPELLLEQNQGKRIPNHRTHMQALEGRSDAFKLMEALLRMELGEEAFAFIRTQIRWDAWYQEYCNLTEINESTILNADARGTIEARLQTLRNCCDIAKKLERRIWKRLKTDRTGVLDKFREHIEPIQKNLLEGILDLETRISHNRNLLFNSSFATPTWETDIYEYLEIQSIYTSWIQNYNVLREKILVVQDPSMPEAKDAKNARELHAAMSGFIEETKTQIASVKQKIKTLEHSLAMAQKTPKDVAGLESTIRKAGYLLTNLDSARSWLVYIGLPAIKDISVTSKVQRDFSEPLSFDVANIILEGVVADKITAPIEIKNEREVQSEKINDLPLVFNNVRLDETNPRNFFPDLKTASLLTLTDSNALSEAFKAFMTPIMGFLTEAFEKRWRMQNGYLNDKLALAHHSLRTEAMGHILQARSSGSSLRGEALQKDITSIDEWVLKPVREKQESVISFFNIFVGRMKEIYARADQNKVVPLEGKAQELEKEIDDLKKQIETEEKQEASPAAIIDDGFELIDKLGDTDGTSEVSKKLIPMGQLGSSSSVNAVASAAEVPLEKQLEAKEAELVGVRKEIEGARRQLLALLEELEKFATIFTMMNGLALAGHQSHANQLLTGIREDQLTMPQKVIRWGIQQRMQQLQAAYNLQIQERSTLEDDDIDALNELFFEMFEKHQALFAETKARSIPLRELILTGNPLADEVQKTVGQKLQEQLDEVHGKIEGVQEEVKALEGQSMASSGRSDVLLQEKTALLEELLRRQLALVEQLSHLSGIPAKSGLKAWEEQVDGFLSLGAILKGIIENPRNFQAHNDSSPSELVTIMRAIKRAMSGETENSITSNVESFNSPSEIQRELIFYFQESFAEFCNGLPSDMRGLQEVWTESGLQENHELQSKLFILFEYASEIMTGAAAHMVSGREKAPIQANMQNHFLRLLINLQYIAQKKPYQMNGTHLKDAGFTPVLQKFSFLSIEMMQMSLTRRTLLHMTEPEFQERKKMVETFYELTRDLVQLEIYDPVAASKNKSGMRQFFATLKTFNPKGYGDMFNQPKAKGASVVASLVSQISPGLDPTIEAGETYETACFKLFLDHFGAHLSIALEGSNDEKEMVIQMLRTTAFWQDVLSEIPPPRSASDGGKGVLGRILDISPDMFIGVALDGAITAYAAQSGKDKNDYTVLLLGEDYAAITGFIDKIRRLVQRATGTGASDQEIALELTNAYLELQQSESSSSVQKGFLDTFNFLTPPNHQSGLPRSVMTLSLVANQRRNDKKQRGYELFFNDENFVVAQCYAAEKAVSRFAKIMSDYIHVLFPKKTTPTYFVPHLTFTENLEFPWINHLLETSSNHLGTVSPEQFYKSFKNLVEVYFPIDGRDRSQGGEILRPSITKEYLQSQFGVSEQDLKSFNEEHVHYYMRAFCGKSSSLWDALEFFNDNDMAIKSLFWRNLLLCTFFRVWEEQHIVEEMANGSMVSRTRSETRHILENHKDGNFAAKFQGFCSKQLESLKNSKHSAGILKLVFELAAQMEAMTEANVAVTKRPGEDESKTIELYALFRTLLHSESSSQENSLYSVFTEMNRRQQSEVLVRAVEYWVQMVKKYPDDREALMQLLTCWVILQSFGEVQEAQKLHQAIHAEFFPDTPIQDTECEVTFENGSLVVSARESLISPVSYSFAMKPSEGKNTYEFTIGSFFTREPLPLSPEQERTFIRLLLSLFDSKKNAEKMSKPSGSFLLNRVLQRVPEIVKKHDQWIAVNQPSLLARLQRHFKWEDMTHFALQTYGDSYSIISHLNLITGRLHVLVSGQNEIPPTKFCLCHSIPDSIPARKNESLAELWAETDAHVHLCRNRLNAVLVPVVGNAELTGLNERSVRNNFEELYRKKRENNIEQANHKIVAEISYNRYYPEDNEAVRLDTFYLDLSNDDQLIDPANFFSEDLLTTKYCGQTYSCLFYHSPLIYGRTVGARRLNNANLTKSILACLSPLNLDGMSIEIAPKAALLILPGKIQKKETPENELILTIIPGNKNRKDEKYVIHATRDPESDEITINREYKAPVLIDQHGQFQKPGMINNLVATILESATPAQSRYYGKDETFVRAALDEERRKLSLVDENRLKSAIKNHMAAERKIAVTAKNCDQLEKFLWLLEKEEKIAIVIDHDITNPVQSSSFNPARKNPENRQPGQYLAHTVWYFQHYIAEGNTKKFIPGRFSMIIVEPSSCAVRYRVEIENGKAEKIYKVGEGKEVPFHLSDPQITNQLVQFFSGNGAHGTIFQGEPADFTREETCWPPRNSVTVITATNSNSPERIEFPSILDRNEDRLGLVINPKNKSQLLCNLDPTLVYIDKISHHLFQNLPKDLHYKILGFARLGKDGNPNMQELKYYVALSYAAIPGLFPYYEQLSFEHHLCLEFTITGESKKIEPATNDKVAGNLFLAQLYLYQGDLEMAWQRLKTLTSDELQGLRDGYVKHHEVYVRAQAIDRGKRETVAVKMEKPGEPLAMRLIMEMHKHITKKLEALQGIKTQLDADRILHAIFNTFSLKLAHLWQFREEDVLSNISRRGTRALGLAGRDFPKKFIESAQTLYKKLCNYQSSQSTTRSVHFQISSRELEDLVSLLKKYVATLSFFNNPDATEFCKALRQPEENRALIQIIADAIAGNEVAYAIFEPHLASTKHEVSILRPHQDQVKRKEELEAQRVFLQMLGDTEPFGRLEQLSSPVATPRTTNHAASEIDGTGSKQAISRYVGVHRQITDIDNIPFIPEAPMGIASAVERLASQPVLGTVQLSSDTADKIGWLQAHVLHLNKAFKAMKGIIPTPLLNDLQKSIQSFETAISPAGTFAISYERFRNYFEDPVKRVNDLGTTFNQFVADPNEKHYFKDLITHVIDKLQAEVTGGWIDPSARTNMLQFIEPKLKIVNEDGAKIKAAMIEKLDKTETFLGTIKTQFSTKGITLGNWGQVMTKNQIKELEPVYNAIRAIDGLIGEFIQGISYDGVSYMDSAAYQNWNKIWFTGRREPTAQLNALDQLRNEFRLICNMKQLSDRNIYQDGSTNGEFFQMRDILYQLQAAARTSRVHNAINTFNTMKQRLAPAVVGEGTLEVRLARLIGMIEALPLQQLNIGLQNPDKNKKALQEASKSWQSTWYDAEGKPTPVHLELIEARNAFKDLFGAIADYQNIDKEDKKEDKHVVAVIANTLDFLIAHIASLPTKLSEDQSLSLPQLSAAWDFRYGRSGCNLELIASVNDKGVVKTSGFYLLVASRERSRVKTELETEHKNALRNLFRDLLPGTSYKGLYFDWLFGGDPQFIETSGLHPTTQQPQQVKNYRGYVPAAAGSQEVIGCLAYIDALKQAEAYLKHPNADPSTWSALPPADLHRTLDQLGGFFSAFEKTPLETESVFGPLMTQRYIFNSYKKLQQLKQPRTTIGVHSQEELIVYPRISGGDRIDEILAYVIRIVLYRYQIMLRNQFIGHFTQRVKKTVQNDSKKDALLKLESIAREVNSLIPLFTTDKQAFSQMMVVQFADIDGSNNELWVTDLVSGLVILRNRLTETTQALAKAREEDGKLLQRDQETLLHKMKIGIKAIDEFDPKAVGQQIGEMADKLDRLIKSKTTKQPTNEPSTEQPSYAQEGFKDAADDLIDHICGTIKMFRSPKRIWEALDILPGESRKGIEDLLLAIIEIRRDRGLERVAGDKALRDDALLTEGPFRKIQSVFIQERSHPGPDLHSIIKEQREWARVADKSGLMTRTQALGTVPAAQLPQRSFPSEITPPRKYAEPILESDAVLPIDPKALHLENLRASIERKKVRYQPTISISSSTGANASKRVAGSFSEIYQKKQVPATHTEVDQDKIDDRVVEEEFNQNPAAIDQEVHDRFGAIRTSLQATPDDVKAGIKARKKEIKKWESKDPANHAQKCEALITKARNELDLWNEAKDAANLALFAMIPQGTMGQCIEDYKNGLLGTNQALVTAVSNYLYASIEHAHLERSLRAYERALSTASVGRDETIAQALFSLTSPLAYDLSDPRARAYLVAEHINEVRFRAEELLGDLTQRIKKDVFKGIGIEQLSAQRFREVCHREGVPVALSEAEAERALTRKIDEVMNHPDNKAALEEELDEIYGPVQDLDEEQIHCKKAIDRELKFGREDHIAGVRRNLREKWKWAPTNTMKKERDAKQFIEDVRREKGRLGAKISEIQAEIEGVISNPTILAYQSKLAGEMKRFRGLESTLIDVFMVGTEEAYRIVFSKEEMSDEDLLKLDDAIRNYLFASTEFAHLERSLEAFDTEYEKQKNELVSEGFNTDPYHYKVLFKTTTEFSSTPTYKLSNERARLYLVFEHREQIRLRAMQVESLNNLTKEDAVIQLLMGEGKTSVIGAMLCRLIANQKEAAVYICPKAQIKTLRENFNNKQGKIFGQNIRVFDIDNHETFTEDYLRQLNKNYRGAIQNGEVIIAPLEFFQMLELERHILFTQKEDADDGGGNIRNRVELIRDTRSSMRKTASVVIDEIDLILYALKEVNFPIGGREAIDPIYRQLKGDFLKYHCSDTLTVELPIGEGTETKTMSDATMILTGNQSQMAAGHYPIILRTIVAKFWDDKLSMKENGWSFDTSNAALKEQFIDYVLDVTASPKKRQFVELLRSGHRNRDEIAILKFLCSQVAPLCMTNKVNADFGRVGIVKEQIMEAGTYEDGTIKYKPAIRMEPHQVVPFVGVLSPAGTEFGQPEEAAFYSLMTAIAQGIKQKQILDIAQQDVKTIADYLKRNGLQIEDLVKREEEYSTQTVKQTTDEMAGIFARYEKYGIPVTLIYKALDLENKDDSIMKQAKGELDEKIAEINGHWTVRAFTAALHALMKPEAMDSINSNPQSDAAYLFTYLREQGWTAEELLGRPGAISEKFIEKVRAGRRKFPNKLIDIEVASMAKTVRFYPRGHFSANAHNACDMFKKKVGFSGTPGRNETSLPMPDVIWDKGTEGKIADTMVNREKHQWTVNYLKLILRELGMADNFEAEKAILAKSLETNSQRPRSPKEKVIEYLINKKKSPQELLKAKPPEDLIHACRMSRNTSRKLIQGLFVREYLKIALFDLSQKGQFDLAKTKLALQYRDFSPKEKLVQYLMEKGQLPAALLQGELPAELVGRCNMSYKQARGLIQQAFLAQHIKNSLAQLSNQNNYQIAKEKFDEDLLAHPHRELSISERLIQYLISHRITPAQLTKDELPEALLSKCLMGRNVVRELIGHGFSAELLQGVQDDMHILEDSDKFDIKKLFSDVINTMPAEKQRRIRGFIDVSGVMASMPSNKAVASAFLDEIKENPYMDDVRYVVFFHKKDDSETMPDTFMAFDRKTGNIKVLGMTLEEELIRQGITRDNIFVIWDQRHCEATNILLKKNAICLLSVNETIDKRSLGQAMLRPRGYFLGQDVEYFAQIKAIKKLCPKLTDPEDFGATHLFRASTIALGTQKARSTVRAYQDKLMNVVRSKIEDAMDELAFEQARELQQAAELFLIKGKVEAPFIAFGEIQEYKKTEQLLNEFAHYIEKKLLDPIKGECRRLVELMEAFEKKNYPQRKGFLEQVRGELAQIRAIFNDPQDRRVSIPDDVLTTHSSKGVTNKECIEIDSQREMVIEQEMQKENLIQRQKEQQYQLAQEQMSSHLHIEFAELDWNEERDFHLRSFLTTISSVVAPSSDKKSTPPQVYRVDSIVQDPGQESLQLVGRTDPKDKATVKVTKSIFGDSILMTENCRFTAENAKHHILSSMQKPLDRVLIYRNAQDQLLAVFMSGKEADFFKDKITTWLANPKRNQNHICSRMVLLEGLNDEVQAGDPHLVAKLDELGTPLGTQYEWLLLKIDVIRGRTNYLRKLEGTFLKKNSDDGSQTRLDALIKRNFFYHEEAFRELTPEEYEQLVTTPILGTLFKDRYLAELTAFNTKRQKFEKAQARLLRFLTDLDFKTGLTDQTLNRQIANVILSKCPKGIQEAVFNDAKISQVIKKEIHVNFFTQNSIPVRKYVIGLVAIGAMASSSATLTVSYMLGRVVYSLAALTPGAYTNGLISYVASRSIEKLVYRSTDDYIRNTFKAKAESVTWRTARTDEEKLIEEKQAKQAEQIYKSPRPTATFVAITWQNVYEKVFMQAVKQLLPGFLSQNLLAAY